MEHAKAAFTPETAAAASISLENQIFLGRMQALVDSLAAWTKREESSQMSRLDWLKIDLLYITDLQNVICEYLQHYAAILKHKALGSPESQYLTAIDGGVDGPYSVASLRTVARTLRLLVNQASNCAFFGCLQVSAISLSIAKTRLLFTLRIKDRTLIIF